MDLENEEDFVDSDLLESTSTPKEMQHSPPSDDIRFQKPALIAQTSSRNSQIFSRGRCRSNDSGFVQPRWTPYPKSSGNNGTPLRTENELPQAASMPPSSGNCSALDMDGFEIAPATVRRLERYRFTPSPEKAVIALPPLPPLDSEHGDVGTPIDLTEFACSGDERLDSSPLPRKGILKSNGSRRLPTSRGTAMNNDPCISFNEPANPVPRTESTSASSTMAEQRHIPQSVDLNKGFEAQDDTMGAETKVEAIAQVQKVEEPEAPLSEEQQKVLKMVLEGQSLFFTGSAGTGKSFLLKEIIRKLRNPSLKSEKGQIVTSKKVAVTASTGIAGVSIGGTTLHSWAGIGLGMGEPSILAARMKRDDAKRGKLAQTAFKRWRETEVLIIDEISMIDGRFWDKLEEIARHVRCNKEPFGGIQLVLCGDFFQLPPVPDRHDRTSVFAFQARTWDNCIKKIFTLTQVFRQKAGSFVQMLNEARIGVLSPSSIRKFAMLDRPIVYTDGIDATELYPIKRQADDANQRRMQALPGETSMYVAIDVPGHKSEGSLHNHADAVKLLDQYCKAPAVLELKVGCQVMLITNIKGGETGLCNGSLGRIVAFETEAAVMPKPEIVVVEQTEEQKIEKKAEQNAKAEKEAQAFDSEGWDTDDDQAGNSTKVEKINKQDLATGSKNLMQQGDAVKRLDADKKGNKWPLVEFTNGQTMLVKPFDFELLSPKGTTEAKRVQVPLILSYALSVHKAQGITLPRMKVDLRQTFERGQAYVALSQVHVSLASNIDRHARGPKLSPFQGLCTSYCHSVGKDFTNRPIRLIGNTVAGNMIEEENFRRIFDETLRMTALLNSGPQRGPHLKQS